METKENVIEKSVVSLVRAETFNYTWKIKNFDHCFVQTLESPRFVIADNEWSVIIYPNGYNSDQKNYLTIRLHQCYVVKEVGHVQVCLIDQEGNPAYIQKEVLASDVFFTKLVKSADLFDKTSGLLTNGELTIKCTVYYNRKLEHETDHLATERAVVDLPVERRLEAVDDFELLLESGKFSDVKLIVGEKEYYVHKGILAVRSQVFAAMFEHDMKEANENVVNIVDVDPEIMLQVLRFIYAGKVASIDTLAGGLLTAADKYGLRSLKTMCEEVLIDQLSLENLSKILVLVDRYDTDKLRDAAMKFLALHGKDFASRENFHDLMKPLSSSLLIDVTQVLMKKM